MTSLSLIVSVLDSREAVRRQLIYLNRIMTTDCELVLVDDGSSPPLRQVCDMVPVEYRLTVFPTRDNRPWTQPCGRNIGTRIASGELLLFFDIDHILTDDILKNAIAYQGDRFFWERLPGVLNEAGSLVTDEQTLREYGWNGAPLGVHPNSFVIRKTVFESLGGYDERFCGRYGGDDIDFNLRYDCCVRTGAAAPASRIGKGYVFPSPADDPKQLFHQLDRG